MDQAFHQQHSYGFSYGLLSVVMAGAKDCTFPLLTGVYDTLHI